MSPTTAKWAGEGDSQDYDVVVLDRDLPKLHGDDLCEQIVASPCTSRILMLTAAGTGRGPR